MLSRLPSVYAAAAIMVSVLRTLVIALAAIAVLDATALRLVLTPATMELLGDRNWWLAEHVAAAVS
jgi:RND superfamily putative drug exporter